MTTILNRNNHSLALRLIAIFLLSSTNEALAIEDTVNNPAPNLSTSNNAIEEVIILAAQSQLSAFEMPYSSTKIDYQQLQQQLPRNMLEALQDVPGVMIQKTANGQGSPFIRGFTGYRTLAMIDGIRYNNSVYRDGPNQYFSLIDSFSLDSIELLSGPAATLYGSDAIGGTLNLQTKSALLQSINSPLTSNNLHKFSPENYLQGSQQYRYASAEHSHLGRTEIALGKPDIWGLTAGISYKNFGDVKATDIGTQAKTGYQERAADLRLDYVVSQHWQLTTVHQSLEQDNVWRTHSTIYAQSFAGTEVGDDQQRLNDQQRSLDYIKLRGEALNNVIIDGLQLTLSQQHWNEDAHRIKSNGEAIIEFFDSRMSGFDLRINKEQASISWVYGIDLYQDNVDTGRTDYNADGSLDQVRIQGPVGDDSQYDLFGAYLQAEWFANERITFLIGSRHTYTKASIGAYEDPVTGAAASFKDSWNSTVSAIRGSYLLTAPTNTQAQWRLWAGISQSFRAPNIADLSRFGKSRSDELEVASTDLNPEHFITYEIGSRIQKNNYQLSSSYFYTDIDQFIISMPTGIVIDELTQVSKQNSSAGYIHGIELDGNYQLSKNWQLLGNMTWLEGKLENYDTDSDSLITEPMSRMMPLTFNLALAWEQTEKQQWLRVAITRSEKADKLSSGDIADTERIPPGGTPAYTLVNISGGQAISKNINATLEINNILDNAYRNHGSGSNEPGRSLIAGLKINF